MLRLFVFIDKLQEENMAPIAFIIGTVWPEPRSSAAGQHLLSLLSELKQLGYIIHFASTAQRSQNSEGLDELGCVVHEIVLNDSSFDQLIAQLQPEIAVFDRFMIEEQFSWRIKKVAPNTCLILDTEDFHSLRYLRHQIVKKHPEQAVDIPSLLEINAGPGPFQGCLNSDFAVREIASMWRCDINLIISQAEVALLHTYYGLPKNIATANIILSSAHIRLFFKTGNRKTDSVLLVLNRCTALYISITCMRFLRHYAKRH